jgi:dTDP-4-dehydrorhamnose 3,5-epimerase
MQSIKFKPGPIEGIQIASRRKIFDDRGVICHMLRHDDPEFQKFGEVYFSQIYLGVVKAWHIHSRMCLNYLLLVGSIRLVLADDREGSPTRGHIQEIILHEAEGKLVVIPPMIWNGFKGIGEGRALVANCATEVHDPTEISRRPHDDPYFQYDWSQRHG